MSVVDAIAVEVVVEAKSACADRVRAQAALADALASARAPRRGADAGNGGGPVWSLRVDVQDEAKTKTATARIVDDRGTLVAERTVSDHTACTPLARAIGAWAALVVDDELARARDASDAPPRNDPRKEEKAVAPAVRLDRSDWRAPQDPDYVPPQTAKPWTLELGVMTYLRDGLAASSGFAGGSPFLNIEVAPGWFVRPSMAFGTSTSRVALDATHTGTFTHVGLRSDFCRRIPGNYIEHRGLELDLCVSGDLSHVGGSGFAERKPSTDFELYEATVHPAAFRVSMGPSAAMRGEIGANTSLELRIAGGYNFRRDPLYREEQAPMIYALAEVGVSWRFR